MLEFLRRRLAELIEERGRFQTDLEAILAAPEAEKRDLNDAEQSAFTEARAKIVAHDAEIDQMHARVKDAQEDLARAERIAKLTAETAPEGETRSETVGEGGGRVGDEPKAYRRGDPNVSWVRDMFNVAVNNPAADEARSRLTRNSREIQVESRALSTTASAGGEFAPPAWLVAEFVHLARAARPTADRVMNQNLPMGISSVNIPKLLTGTATAQQGTQNTAVQATDATTGSVTAAIVTIAGQQVVSQQLLDQSGVNIDDILLQDLAMDYAAKVDLFVLNNNATNAKGLLKQSGTTGITYTSASPKAYLLFAQIAAAIAGVQAVRYLPPDTIVMHPRRWAALIGSADTANRPLFAVNGGAVSSQAGTVDRNYAAQGVVGTLAGLDVITDPQIPINTGAGTNEDTVIVMRAADNILWEGSLKSEAFRETKADQLSVLLRVYNYAAFTANRYAASTALITGTGLVTPAFDGS